MLMVRLSYPGRWMSWVAWQSPPRGRSKHCMKCAHLMRFWIGSIDVVYDSCVLVAKSLTKITLGVLSFMQIYSVSFKSGLRKVIPVSRISNPVHPKPWNPFPTLDMLAGCNRHRHCICWDFRVHGWFHGSFRLLLNACSSSTRFLRGGL